MTKEELIEYGLKVFDTEQQFNVWLSEINYSLGFPPEKLLETEEGRNKLEILLYKIDYGLFL